MCASSRVVFAFGSFDFGTTSVIVRPLRLAAIVVGLPLMPSWRL